MRNPFAKKPAPAPKPEPRKWDIPAKDIPKVLRALDKAQAGAGHYGPQYEFWAEVEKILPETHGVACRINFRGAVPYVEEVIA